MAIWTSVYVVVIVFIMNFIHAAWAVETRFTPQDVQDFIESGVTGQRRPVGGPALAPAAPLYQPGQRAQNAAGDIVELNDQGQWVPLAPTWRRWLGDVWSWLDWQLTRPRPTRRGHWH